MRSMLAPLISVLFVGQATAQDCGDLDGNGAVDVTGAIDGSMSFPRSHCPT
eukprot:SAG31_NODE_996_length_10492_cov_4.648802_5_plen_51_part_00